jgi:hypothetical protein
MAKAVMVQNRSISKAALWTGRVLSGLVTLFLLWDASMKIARVRVAVEGTVKLGYADSVVVPIGIVLLISTILYAVPRTSAFGAILLTGYLGGAVATNVRAGLPLALYILFPVYVGVLAWLGLYLRNIPIRKTVPLLQED